MKAGLCLRCCLKNDENPVPSHTLTVNGRHDLTKQAEKVDSWHLFITVYAWLPEWLARFCVDPCVVAPSTSRIWLARGSASLSSLHFQPKSRINSSRCPHLRLTLPYSHLTSYVNASRPLPRLSIHSISYRMITIIQLYSRRQSRAREPCTLLCHQPCRSAFVSLRVASHFSVLPKPSRPSCPTTLYSSTPASPPTFLSSTTPYNPAASPCMTQQCRVLANRLPARYSVS